MCAAEWGSMTASWYEVCSLLSEGRQNNSIFIANGTATTHTHTHFSGTQPIGDPSGRIVTHPGLMERGGG